ncbi:DNA ligase [compost metagenome]
MNDVARAIMTVGRTPGRNDKMGLLEYYKDVPGFKEILQYIYNPYLRTGIAAAKLKKAKPHIAAIEFTWQQIIEYYTKHQTGRDEDVSLAKGFIQAQQTEDATALAEALVTKTLKIGVTATSLNKAYGDDFIPMLGIMKAEKYKDYKNKVKGPFIVTEKFDGARRVVVKKAGWPNMFTRSGHEDDLAMYPEIAEELKYLPDNFVIDTEGLKIGDFPDSIALRQASNGLFNSKGTKRGVELVIFDALPLSEFETGRSVQDAATRKILIAAMFKDPSLKLLRPDDYQQLIDSLGIDYNFKYLRPAPILGIATTEDEVLSFAEPIWARHYEGVMLNTFDGKYDYIVDRSRDILKVKKVEELVVTVTGFTPGEGEFEGMAGALTFDYKGNQVKAGSGLSVAQRRSIWADPAKYIGRQMEIDTFGESTDKSGKISLNVPIFKRFVGEE